MNTHTSQRRSERHISPVLGIALLILLMSTFGGRGAPTTADQAMNAVTGWLKADQSPLQTTLGQQVKNVRRFGDANQTLYYVVYLNPEGFVIVAADDLIEPIIGFAPRGEFDPSTDNPLGALVSSDMPSRLAAVQAAAGAKTQSLFSAAKDKWGQLESLAQKATLTGNGLPSISDVRVAPLIQTLWDQMTAGGNACYNYYTPPYGAGISSNYYCGCVATAMAQLMRFWQYPVNGVGTASFWITNNGTAQLRSLRGGNGAGSPYVWSNMVTNPASSSTLAQRQAIGALCADAGVSVHMNYNAAVSLAYMENVPIALTNTFYYTRAVCGENANYNIGAGLNGMVNPNLDSGFPVLFGITGTSGGHAVVCDGYGYNVGTLYHHLNLGWSGTDTAWYALPTIETSHYTFTTLNSCVYNVWTSGTGEIISGRVLDSGGTPIAGVTVTATRSAGETYTASSDARGIYALAKIPSLSTYLVSASKAGYSFTTQTIRTELSTDYLALSGNQWGVSITGTVAAEGAPVIISQPQSQTVAAGASAGFNVVATGTTPLNYQWLFNGQPIPTATGPSYTIARVQSVQAGTYTVVVSNSYDSVLSSPATLAITSGSGAFGIIGSPFIYQIVANNNPTWYSASGLPSGLSCNGTSGLISGIPTRTGTYSVRVEARSLYGSVSATILLTIANGAITSATSAQGLIGVPFIYKIISDNSPTAYSASGLPPGLSYSVSSGLISGTPTQIGTFSVRVEARNLYGSASATIRFTIAASAITSAATAQGVAGMPFIYLITANNNPTAYSASGLPPGLSYSVGSGLISGIPTQTGTFSVHVQASNLYGTASATIVFTIANGAITSAASAPGVIGVPLIYRIVANNNPTAYSASGLPPGLGYSVSSGLISGIPSQTGTFSAHVQARNLYGTASATVVFTIANGAITSAASAPGVIGVPFLYRITANNSPTAYSASGLPPGLSYSVGSGLISGIPSQIGAFPVHVEASNIYGSASASISMTISDGAIGTVTQPAITILQTNNSFLLAWPVTPAGFVLEETQVQPNTWTNSSVQVVVQGNQYVATITPAGGAKFFRLRKQ